MYGSHDCVLNSHQSLADADPEERQAQVLGHGERTYQEVSDRHHLFALDV
jgi:hypothetical protein